MTVHKLLTRRLHPIVTTLSITKTTVKGRTYKRAHAKIPIELAETLAGGKNKTYVVILVGRASHLHAQYWDARDDPLWARLDPKLREELEILGNTEWSPSEVTLIPARPEQLRELGLDPDQPLTLEDVVEAVRRRLTAGTPGGGDGQEAKPQASPKPAQ